MPVRWRCSRTPREGCRRMDDERPGSRHDFRSHGRSGRGSGQDVPAGPRAPHLTESVDVADAIVGVLAEAGIEYVLGIPGGYTGDLFAALHAHDTIRVVQVREESLGSAMAEAYGRLTGRPLVVMGQGEWIAGNAGQGFLEALLGSSPMVILTEMSDGGALSHHAPYQGGTGDYGSWGRPHDAPGHDQAGHGEPLPGPGRSAHATRHQARIDRRPGPGGGHLPR